MLFLPRFSWVVFFLASCLVPVSAQKDNQTQVFAAARAARVSNVQYEMTFDLSRGSDTYTGSVDIMFDLVDGDEDLRIDFSGPEITSLAIDSTTVDEIQYDREEGALVLPTAMLTGNTTLVQIAFVGAFTNAGAGFHRFVDPVDGLEYHYTDFQPYDAHRMFPCFDQPDIKASYQIQVLAPADWTVVTNASAIRHMAEGDRRRTFFAKTNPFSTYLFHLSAGAYASFYDPSFRYPLGIYCRQSLAEHVDAERFFEATRKGFDFFEDYFDFPYPFEKYDQIFVPEFNAGAMENVAAVTWTEGFIFRRKPTQQQHLYRDMVNYHEMAHMWFGDIVTLKWWNDLWLNESFASYMAYVALAGTGNDNAWNLANTEKDGGMTADQKVTTHPIITAVPDIRAAANIFDAITYNKGLAVLRQWDAYLGEHTFRDGVRTYLKRHAFENTVFSDFVAAMEASSGQPLDSWVDRWLKTVGVNTVQLAYDIENGKMANVEMRQKPSRFNEILRPHAIDVGLYYADDSGQPVMKQAVMVRIDGASTPLPDLNGLPAPLFALPNISEYGYVKVALDQQSLDWVRHNIGVLQDSQTKLQLWRLLWKMVRDTEMSPKAYLELAMAQLPSESNSLVLGTIADRIASILVNYNPAPAVAEPYKNRLFDLAKLRLSEVEAGSEMQGQWYSLLYVAAYTTDQLDTLVDLYKGEWVVPGLDISVGRKWTIVSRLKSLGHPQADALAEEMKAADTSARAKNYGLYFTSLKPNETAKRAAWERVLNDESLSLSEATWLAFGIFTSAGYGAKPELATAFLDDYFAMIPELYETRDWEFVSRMLPALFPDNAGQVALDRGRAFLKKASLDATLRNLILEELDDLEKILAIRANWDK